MGASSSDAEHGCNRQNMQRRTTELPLSYLYTSTSSTTTQLSPFTGFGDRHYLCTYYLLLPTTAVNFVVRGLHYCAGEVMLFPRKATSEKFYVNR